ncbi:MAG: PTS transporter subunit EIIA [Aeromonadales bacterium]|nr:PTS transporter subunit EIIA [Aeromonadales bacterium]
MINNKLSLKWFLPYSIFAIARDTVYVFILCFYFTYLTKVIGLSIKVILPVFIGIKVLDIIKEPLLGYLMDSSSKNLIIDKYRVFILTGSLFNGLFIIMMFNQDLYSHDYQLAVATILFSLWTVSFSVYDIPSWSIISSFNANNRSREIASAVARGTSMIGYICALLLVCCYISPSSFINNINLSSYNGIFKYGSIAITCAIIVSSSLFTIFYKSNIETNLHKNLGNAFKAFFKNDQLMIVFALCTFQQIIFNIFTNEYSFFVKHIKNSALAKESFLYLHSPWIIFSLLAFVSFPMLTRLLSRKTVFLISIGLPIIGITLLLIPISFHELTYATFFTTVAIFTFGVSLSLVSTTVMLSDCVDYGEFKFGGRIDCMNFSVQTVSAKLGVLFIFFISIFSVNLNHTDKFNTVEHLDNFTIYLIVVINILCGIAIGYIYMNYYKLHGSFFENILNTLSSFGKNDSENSFFSRANSVRYAIDEHCVINNLDSDNIDDILKVLTDRLYQVKAINSKQAFLDGIYKKLEKNPAGIAHGIAIPHARGSFVNRSALSIARVRKPIECGAIDNKPCDLFFLIAVPDDGVSHMKVLGNLSLMLSIPGFANKLRNSGSTEEITKRLIACERNLFN